MKSGWESSPPDGLAEDARARRLECGAPVLLAIVSSASVWVIAACDTILFVALTCIENDTRVSVVAEMAAYRWGLVAF
jgi:hypothetical protein